MGDVVICRLNVIYQNVAKKLTLNDYRKQSFDILRARGSLQKKATKVEKEKVNSPLYSHESMRLVMGGGIRNGESFEEVAYRPAYHSLTDNGYGMLKGAEINFLEGKLRHYDNRNKTVLQNLDLLTIRSLSPIDEMFAPTSFQIKANVERWQNPENEKEGYVGNLNVGLGGGMEFLEKFTAFLLFDTKLRYGGFLPHNSMIVLGADMGVLADFDKWKILAEIKPQIASQKIGESITYEAEVNYVIDTNLSVGSRLAFEEKNGADEEEFVFGVRFYF